jgi:hypothetical protein
MYRIYSLRYVIVADLYCSGSSSTFTFQPIKDLPTKVVHPFEFQRPSSARSFLTSKPLSNSSNLQLPQPLQPSQPKQPSQSVNHVSTINEIQKPTTVVQQVNNNHAKSSVQSSTVTGQMIGSCPPSPPVNDYEDVVVDSDVNDFFAPQPVDPPKSNTSQHLFNKSTFPIPSKAANFGTQSSARKSLPTSNNTHPTNNVDSKSRADMHPFQNVGQRASTNIPFFTGSKVDIRTIAANQPSSYCHPTSNKVDFSPSNQKERSTTSTTLPSQKNFLINNSEGPRKVSTSSLPQIKSTFQNRHNPIAYSKSPKEQVVINSTHSTNYDPNRRMVKNPQPSNDSKAYQNRFPNFKASPQPSSEQSTNQVMGNISEFDAFWKNLSSIPF